VFALALFCQELEDSDAWLSLKSFLLTSSFRSNQRPAVKEAENENELSTTMISI